MGVKRTLKAPGCIQVMSLTLCLFLSLDSVYGEQQVEYSPPVVRDYPGQVFWGDTHLHTNLSADAFSFGNQEITPEKAYRFARGETVVAQSGVRAKLARPLDFLMVSDHSEFIGIFPRVFNRSPDILGTPLGKRWISYIEAGAPERVTMEFGLIGMGAAIAENQEKYITPDSGITKEFLDALQGVKIPDELIQSIWDQVGATADSFNEPGRFTTFIGYEWTSMPDGNNLHRNVMFRDGAGKPPKLYPFLPWIAATRRTCGSTWPSTRIKRAGRCLLFRTTVT